MDFKYLLLSFEGRIGRKQFWMGLLALIVISLVVGAVLIALGLGSEQVRSGTVQFDGGGGGTFRQHRYFLSPIGNLIQNLILLWPLLALAIKRRHDKGAPGTEVYVLVALNFIEPLIAMAGWIPGFVSGLIGIIQLVLTVYLIVVLGFLKGDDGANAYGPDPLAK